MAKLTDTDGEFAVNQLKEMVAHIRNGDPEAAQRAADRLIAEAGNPDAVRNHIQQKLNN